MIYQPRKSYKRRDRHDIVREMLKTAIPGKKKTNIMYKTNLSHGQSNRYFSLLIKKGLLEEITINPNPQRNESSKILKTTDKGYELYLKLEKFDRLWESGST